MDAVGLSLEAVVHNGGSSVSRIFSLFKRVRKRFRAVVCCEYLVPYLVFLCSNSRIFKLAHRKNWIRKSGRVTV